MKEKEKRGDGLIQGLIQVYCGEGKGKTTAAIGQGIRAVGQNLKVIMVQFLKSSFSGEMEALKQLEPEFKLFRFEKERDFFWNLTDTEKEDIKIEIENGINFVKKVLDTEECDVIILDEILGVLKNHLYPTEEFCKIIDDKPESIEMILTGRELPDIIAQRADYISTIQVIKHPIEKGIQARQGIEY